MELFAEAYNAHETAEQAALEAIEAHLRTVPLTALACLCDPDWRWETRSWMSEQIIEQANEVLNEQLEALVTWSTERGRMRAF